MGLLAFWNLRVSGIIDPRINQNNQVACIAPLKKLVITGQSWLGGTAYP